MKGLQKVSSVCLVMATGIFVMYSRSLSALVGNTNNPWLEIGWTNDTAALAICDPTTNACGIHDVFYATNLMLPGGWAWLVRCAPGQTNLVVTCIPPAQGFFQLGINNAIRPGFTNNFLPPEDDGPSLMAPLPLTINFYGSWCSNVWVNNNGNVTFDNPLSVYVPASLKTLGYNIIAPYWADVDTRNPASAVVSYGTNTVDGHNAFGVDWVNVGYYSEHADKLLSCQLLLIDRSDIAPGDFDMEFNYFKVQWEWGDVSVNDPPHAGFSDGVDDVELPGSGVEGALMDTNVVTGLIYNHLNSPVPGRYVFSFRDGTPLP